MEDKKETSLAELFFTFAKVGVMTFGGGYAMLPILQREVVEKKKWASGEDLADYFAIGQCTPGIIAVNTATFIGHRTRGVIGGIVATLGLVFPSLLIIMAIAGTLQSFSENPIIQKAFAGIRTCVCVLIASAIYKLWKSAVNGKLTFIIFLIAVLLSFFLHVSPVLIVLGGIIVGILFAVFHIDTKGSDAEDAT